MTVMHYFGIKATSNIMQNRAELFCGTVTTDTDYLQSFRAMEKYLEYVLPHLTQPCIHTNYGQRNKIRPRKFYSRYTLFGAGTVFQIHPIHTYR